MQLSIVIPTHRRADSLVRLLKSFRKQSLEPNLFEVIVVSNLPDQETELQLSQLTPKFNLRYFTVGKVGVNWARNVGLEKAQADFVFFLDDDCELTNEDHFFRLVKIHNELPDVAAVGGLYTLPDSANEFELAYTKMANGWIRESLKGKRMQVKRLLGGNVCYKKLHLQKEGLSFNSEIVFGGAETELHDRMIERKLDLRLSDLSVCHHVKLDAQTFFTKALRQGYGSRFSEKENSSSHLGLLSRKKLPLLEFQYRQLYRAGQLRAKRKKGWPSSKMNSRQVWYYDFLTRAIKWTADTEASINRSLNIAFWFLFHQLPNHIPVMVSHELKKLNVRIRTGIDQRLTGYKLSVSEKPSAYLPISKKCELDCDYCHLIKAKDDVVSGQTSAQLASDLGRMGYRRVTIPCNTLSLQDEELETTLQKLESFEKEVLLNPDLVNQSNWKPKVADLHRRGFEFLVLHRPGLFFRDLYRHLKTEKMNFRILSVQDISPDLTSLYSIIYPEDQRLVEWLSTSAVEPILRDPRNRSWARKIAGTFRYLEREQIKTLPKSSNLHYPFLIPNRSYSSMVPSGDLAWSSPSSDRNSLDVRHSIVVPVRFQNAHACKILRNFSALNYDKSGFEIVYVDDGNESKLAPLIQQTFEKYCDPDLQVKVIRWDRLAGEGFDDSYRAGQARNLGVWHSRGKNLLFVDSDILVSPMLLKELDQKLKNNMLVQFPRHMLKPSASKSYVPYNKIKVGQDTYQEEHYWEQFKS
ncbi:MAG: glycosyltransferase, partial [Pseudomonadota bacterium]